MCFDITCNNLYILTQTMLQKYTFYEMYCGLEIELRSRGKFVDRVVDDYFSVAD